ncbi:hypothetical protein D9758_017616 [Tetrapyrgos nigripes]|uniref:HAT C-terminal dimerisation domain-containing protein n=1 Tax=Tetrapyrgos nigripes TaxID=182062 RepID=A0A8H5BY91_9AGAR|nr:hypothetical protein D9758_017616 [Tetrapyrgos nigripes]
MEDLLSSYRHQVTATRNSILGKEDIATSNWVIPAMHEVKEEWEEFLESPTYEIIAPAIQAGLDSMYKWYRRVTEDTPVYFISHVLDPRRRLAFLDAAWEQSLVDKGMRLMRKVFLEYKNKIQAVNPSQSAKQPVQPSSSDSSADTYMDNFIAAKQKQKPGSGGTSTTVSQYQELDKRADSEVDMSRYHQVRHQAIYPVLSMIARDYLAIPASSSKSERHFSSAGLTDDPRRGRMGNGLFTALQCLKGAYKDGRLSAREEAWMLEKASFDFRDAEQAETQ